MVDAAASVRTRLEGWKSPWRGQGGMGASEARLLQACADESTTSRTAHSSRASCAQVAACTTAPGPTSAASVWLAAESEATGT